MENLCLNHIDNGTLLSEIWKFIIFNNSFPTARDIIKHNVDGTLAKIISDPDWWAKLKNSFHSYVSVIKMNIFP